MKQLHEMRTIPLVHIIYVLMQEIARSPFVAPISIHNFLCYDSQQWQQEAIISADNPAI